SIFPVWATNAVRSASRATPYGIGLRFAGMRTANGTLSPPSLRACRDERRRLFRFFRIVRPDCAGKGDLCAGHAGSAYAVRQYPARLSLGDYPDGVQYRGILAVP